MRTVASTRQTHQPGLPSAPQALTWLVFLRDNAKLTKLTKIEWALAAILPTCGQGQNITLSVKGMADILDSDRETIGTALKGLIAKGLVLYVGPGKNNKSVYRLTLPKVSVTPTAGVGHTDSKVSVTPTADVGQTDTTSRTHEEVDEDHINMRSAQDDDVATSTPSGKTKDRAKGSARSTSTRATKASSATKVRPVEEFVADLEKCRDELARRLGVDPGSVTVKPLAKQLRNLDIKHDETAMWSELLDLAPDTDTIWSMSASKDNPVGFLKFALEQRLEGNDVTDYYRPPAGAPAVDDEPEDPARAKATELVKEYAALSGQAPGDVEAELRGAHLSIGEAILLLQSRIDKARANDK